MQALSIYRLYPSPYSSSYDPVTGCKVVLMRTNTDTTLWSLRWKKWTCIYSSESNATEETEYNWHHNNNCGSRCRFCPSLIWNQQNNKYTIMLAIRRCFICWQPTVLGTRWLIIIIILKKDTQLIAMTQKWWNENAVWTLIPIILRNFQCDMSSPWSHSQSWPHFFVCCPHISYHHYFTKYSDHLLCG